MIKITTLFLIHSQIHRSAKLVLCENGEKTEKIKNGLKPSLALIRKMVCKVLSYLKVTIFCWY